MEAGSDGVEDVARKSKSPPRSAALARGETGAGAGGGVEEAVGGSSSRPLSAAPALGASVASGGSGGGGPGGRLRDVGNDALEQLIAGGHVEAAASGSAADFRARTDPASYRRDVDVEKAEDVLTVQKVLEEVKDPDRSRAFPVHYPRLNLDMTRHSGALEEWDDAADAPPTRSGRLYSQIYEILSFVIDKPNLLTQLPSFLSGIGLDIRDAHAFSRKDRYNLNDFIVECWHIEDAEGLQKVLAVLILINKGLWSNFGSSSTNILLPFHTDDCDSDIDTTLLNIGEKITPGSCGVMFHGTYYGAKIIFGILSLAYLDQNAWNKFTKEICTSREAHHANIARLLGPCTKPRQFCTTTEYMSEGSLFCFLRDEHVVFDLPTLLKLAQDGCRSTDYLRHKGTIPWNFNPADLLMDKQHVVGVGKFGLPCPKDRETTRTAKIETHKSIVPEGRSCGYCETTLATIQSLDRLVPTLEKILEQLSKHCTAVQDSHGTEEVKKLDTEDAEGSSSEKNAVISFFVIFVTVWFLGLFLSQFGHGHRCTCFASAFTACAAICAIAFVDYSLCKCFPEDTLYLVLFALHFTAMVLVIGYLWFTYIKVPQLPTIQWMLESVQFWRRYPPLPVHAQPKDGLAVPLVNHDIV